MAFNKSLHGSANRSSQATRVLTTNLRENIEMIKKATGNSPDIGIREWCSEGENLLEAVVIYASGLADVKFINQFIMEPLISSHDDEHSIADRFPAANLLDFFKNKLLSVGEFQDGASADTLMNGILLTLPLGMILYSVSYIIIPNRRPYVISFDTTIRPFYALTFGSCSPYCFWASR